MISRLLQHARHATRLLVRAPLFTLTAVLSLAIGIGANTTIFSVANALLLSPTRGIADPDRVVDIGQTRRNTGFDSLSFPTYQDVQREATLLDGVYALDIEPRPISLTRDAGAVPITAQTVSASFFDVLGVVPQAGAFFVSSEERVGVPLRKVVLSDAFWRRTLNADRAVVGTELILNGQGFSVVAIAPPGFHGTTILAPDVWVPLTSSTRSIASDEMLRGRQNSALVLGARMKPGVTLDQVRAELAGIDRALNAQFPGMYEGKKLVAVPTSRVPGEAGGAIIPIVAVLMAVVGLVLLVACTNLAGLMLARAASRSREIAVRLALGASRGNLVAQLLTESLLVFAIGAAGAVVLAMWMTSALLAMLPALPVPIAVDFSLDTRVLVFTAGLALLTGLLTGLAPALQSTRANVVRDLKVNAATPSRQRLRHGFMAAQMALCLVLLVTAGLFLRAFSAATNVTPGFDVRPIDVVTLDLSLGGYDDAQAPMVTEQLQERLASIPGVESVAAGAVVPLEGMGLGLGDLRKYRAPAGEDSNFDEDWNVISPEFLATLRLPLAVGRHFAASDRSGSPDVAIVNETFARRLWPGEDPIGRQLEMGDFRPGRESDNRVLTVVGIARDAKYRWLGDGPRNFIYVPVAQHASRKINFFVRRSASPANASLAPDIRQVVRQFNPNLPVVRVMALSEFASLGLLPQLLAASVAGSLGTVALLLAAIGIYGVTAFAVARRTREIGVRMALGADYGSVMRLMITQAMKITLVGGAIGLAMAAGLAQLLGDLLFGISPIDPVAFGSMATALLLVTLLASYLPARRAARVNPVVALRMD